MDTHESVPAQSDLDTSGADIPTPLASFDAMNETERVLAADLLRKRAGTLTRGPVRIRLLRDRFLVLVPDTDRAKIEEALLPLFSAPTSVAVESRIRDIASLGTLGASRIRPEFVRGQTIDFGGLWGAIVNTFPSSCDLDIDSTSVRNDKNKATFYSHVSRVPSSEAFSGVIVKKRIRVELVGTAADATNLSVEEEIYWRPRTRSSWTRVASAEELEPGMVSAQATLGVTKCKKGILRAILP